MLQDISQRGLNLNHQIEQQQQLILIIINKLL